MANRVRGEFIRRLSAAVLPALLGLCALPAPARAEWQEFIPTPYLSSLALDVGGDSERIETTHNDQRRTEKDLFLKERLTFVNEGFIYHPRFIQYHLMLAAALKQETYNNNDRETVTKGTGLDYDLRLNVLPEHPYKLNLFTSRTEPLYKQYSSTVESTLTTRRGAEFIYRQKPYFLKLHYTDSLREWEHSSSDLGVYGANGTYFKEFEGGRTFSLTGTYDHAAVRPSSGPNGTSESYGIINTIDQNTSSLQSRLSRFLYHQGEERENLDTDEFVWFERLNLKLPLHFRSIVTYEYQKYSQTVAPAPASGEEVRSGSSRDFGVDIIQKLYRSLETTYRLRRNMADSMYGETTSTLNSLFATYSKTVPYGLLLAGANVSRSETDSSGRGTVANEAHGHLDLNEVFTTMQRNADCGTILVFLTDHTAGDRPVLVDFVAVPSPDARCDIMVTGLPSAFDETAPHDYTISYALESGNYTLRSDSYGYNAGLNLFNNNVNPYFSRMVTSAKVVSGTYPGSPFDGTLSTVGVTFGNLPLRVLGEYQQSDGSVNTYRRWRGEVDYNQSVTTTTYVAMNASYIRTDYPEGSTIGSPQAYTDEASRFAANLQQRLFNRSLVLSGGGTYTLFQGLMKSSAYTLNANLQWRTGKTTVTAGANSYSSQREDRTAMESGRVRQYYYLNVRREIF
jgi:hypothetical protein